uniref:PBPe domain-containing protein n=1 Tax=Meloidogyne hapla TaxID=6305 RepID=A0A1I8AXZ4_MELHA
MKNNLSSGSLNNEVIRVVFARNPPDAFPTCNTFPTMSPNVKCPFPGWMVEVVKMLADSLHMEIEPIIIESNIGSVNWGHQFDPNTENAEKAFTPDYGLPTRGNWTGILGLLEQGLADTVCTLYPYTEQKANFFNFSHPVTAVRDIYIAKPKRKSLSVALWNAFFPYEKSLWFLLLFSLLVQCGVASLVANMEYRLNLRPTYNPLEKIWQYLRLQIHQATEFQTPFFLQSGNLAFLFYALIQATLFTQLYTAVLLSSLIRGENPRPWESYNEMIRLVKANEYTLIMDKHHLEKDNSFFEMLNFTRMSHLRNLASAIETNPIRIVDNVSVALDFVERGGFILPTKQYSLAYQMSKERCDLFYFEDDHNQIPTFFIFSRQSKELLRKWNRAIQRNQAFIRRTYDKYFFNDFNTGKIPNCIESDGSIGGLASSAGGDDDNRGETSRHFASNSARDASRSLDIFATFGIFLIAILGFGIATITFIFELIIHSKSQRILRKWRTRRALVMANPALPVNLMVIAREFREARQQRQQRAYKNADSQQSTEGPKFLFGVSTSSSAVERNELMLPADLLNAKKGENSPPRLSKTVGRSWWRHK